MDEEEKKKEENELVMDFENMLLENIMRKAEKESEKDEVDFKDNKYDPPKKTYQFVEMDDQNYNNDPEPFMSPYLKIQKVVRPIDEQFYVAVRRGDWVEINNLLIKGADPNFHYHDLVSPLHVAVENDDCNLVDILLRHKDTKPNMKNIYGKTPLIIAIEKGNNKIAIRLIVEKIDVNEVDNLGRTSIHFAARLNNLRMINFLMKSGARHDIKDNFGEDPLHYAMMRDSITGSILLLRLGADPNSRNYIGVPLLSEIAISRTFRRKKLYLKLLLRYGSDVNLGDLIGYNTPLYFAILADDLESVELLIENGADPTLSNRVGLTPLDYAKKFKFYNIAKYINSQFYDKK